MSYRGFTLIELMIVVAIIAIIAAIAIPNLMASQRASWQSAAAGTMRTIFSTVETYRVKNLTYPPSETAARDATGSGRTLFESVTGCPVVGVGAAKSYTFIYESSGGSSWTCAADSDFTDLQDFYIDQSGVLRAAQSTGNDCQATSTSNPFSG